MGGFTLGGGTSVLSTKHGYALDSVLMCDVSAAPRRIYLSLLTGNPDLYYAAATTSPS
jgi:hypothetical protein